MKKCILAYTVIWLYCFCNAQQVVAQQVLAAAQKSQLGGKSKGDLNSLIMLLKKLEQVYQTTFVYQKELLENKTFSGTVNESDKLEIVLEHVLKPANLRFQKLRGGGYTILPRKAEKGGQPETELLKTTGTAPAEPATNNLLAMNTEMPKATVKMASAIRAADIVVRGIVTDIGKAESIPGASIVLKGTNRGTTTDANGAFSIAVTTKESILVFSYVGFETQEVVVGDRTQLDILLKADNKSLDEVVVVGYGTQKKINATGAISSMGTKELTQSPTANISNSLVGRLPGLFASQASGEPGNDQSKIRIRGVGTFTGNTDPLILVDGIQVDNYNNIDPNEIDNVTILKDASSTAVYGIRGANGVLIITTRRGKTGKPKVSYTFNLGSNSFTTLRKGMNSYDYANSFNQAIKADNYVTSTNTPPKYSDTDLAKYKSGEDPIFFPSTDWYGLLLRKSSLQTQQNINVSGGQAKMKYFISAGLFNQEGLFNDFSNVVTDYTPQSTYKRYNFRSNFDFQVTKRFRVAIDVAAQTEDRSGNNGNGGTDRVLGDIARASPLSGPGVVDNKIVNLKTGENNPVASYLGSNGFGGLRREYRNYLNGTVKLDHDMDFITKGLGIHGKITYQTYNNQLIVNQKNVPDYFALRLDENRIVYLPDPVLPESAFAFTQTGTNFRRVAGQFSLDYQRTFGDHGVTGLVLYDQQKTFDPSLAFLIPKGYQSVVSRVTYSYKTKYLAEFNAGYNGTENFAPGKRFGFFPAGSVGWVPSDESFFPKTPLITFLKIRASYGEVGNDNIGGNRFLYRPTAYTYKPNLYYFGNVGTSYTGYQGVAEGAAGNPNVTWERALKTDIGLEANLFSDKVKITADVFNEDRNSILASPATIPVTVGFVQPTANLGRMNNKGFDGDISYADNIGEVTFRVSANYSFARNKILFQDEVPKPYAYQNRTGQRYGQFYGLIADGLYNTWAEVNDPNRPVYQGNNKIQPGDIKFRDVNGDGLINDNDQVPIGYSNIPEKTYGLSLSVRYKGFDMSVLFQGTGNVSLYYSGKQRNSGFGGSPPEGTANYLIESWTPKRYAAGLPISFPRFTVGQTPNNAGSSFFLADASYTRLKNAEIGYSLQPKLLKRIGMSSMRVYASANNLLTWSKVYKGVDPENLPATDTNNDPYPLVRTINGGININF